MVWWYSATLIATGAAFALGLVAMFLFPFLPFIGMFLLFQGSAYADASRGSEPEKQEQPGDRDSAVRDRLTPPPRVPSLA